MLINKKLYKKIEKNRRILEKKISRLDLETNLEKKIELAQNAVDFATYRGTGYYSSGKLEDFYVSLAKNIKTDTLAESFKKNTFLHVMSEAYTAGGHTRVVEKWVENFSTEYSHSLVLINQPSKNALPCRLVEGVQNSSGEIIFINSDDNLFQKADYLRRLAVNFEYIVLHVHMNDPVPIVAFGTEEFKRPVILFNHANHMFWLGVSIADIVAELSSNYITLFKEKRHLRKVMPLGIPLDLKKNVLKEKFEAREVLSIPHDKKVILTVGSTFKYKKMMDFHYTDLIKILVQKNPDIIFYAIGPSKNDKYWSEANKKYPNQIIPIGMVDYNREYYDYISASDLVLDSFPMAGGTVMIDAVSSNRPVVSLKTPVLHFDYIANSIAYSESVDEWVEKILNILDDDDYAYSVINSVKKNINDEIAIDIWNSKLKNILNDLPENHSVTKFSNSSSDCTITDNCAAIELMYTKDYYKDRYKKFKNKIRRIIKRIFKAK